MPKEIFPSSYECDCGYVAHFFENTVKEIKKLSQVKQQWLADGTGTEEHMVVFEDGEMTTMLCPKQGHSEKRPARYTVKQGRYLAFINQYTSLHGVAPAEHEMQEFLHVSPPAVHQMVLTLERKGLIERTPGEARSIKVLVSADELPRVT